MTGNSSSPGGSITLVRGDDGKGWVARLTGEVDAAVVEAFTADAAPDAQPTAVEAEAVTFIDSSGLALILRWATRARERGCSAELRRPSEAVLTLLRLSGTQSLFAEPAGGSATR